MYGALYLHKVLLQITFTLENKQPAYCENISVQNIIKNNTLVVENDRFACSYKCHMTRLQMSQQLDRLVGQ